MTYSPGQIISVQGQPRDYMMLWPARLITKPDRLDALPASLSPLSKQAQKPSRKVSAPARSAYPESWYHRNVWGLKA